MSGELHRWPASLPESMVVDLDSRPCDLCGGGYAEPTMPVGSYVIHPHHGSCRNGMSEYERRCFDALMMIDAFEATPGPRDGIDLAGRLKAILKGEAG